MSAAIPFATTAKGETVFFDPDGVSGPATPHLLIAGAAGTGKSQALGRIVTGAAAAGWETYTVAVGGHTPPIPGRLTTSFEDTEQMLAELVAEAERRTDLRDTARAGQFPRILLSIDEASSVLRQDILPGTDQPEERANTQRNNEARTRINGHLGTLVRLAKTAKVSIIIAMQRPSGTLLDRVPGIDTWLKRADRLLLGDAQDQLRMIVLRNPKVKASGKVPAAARGRGVYEPVDGKAVTMHGPISLD